ncbi:hypothetical protein [Ekhidna sp.]|uniref:hypothetical protein n=1 Tax=Ekhidna sp. TaxID=2608089 RepID=UPI0032EABEF8
MRSGIDILENEIVEQYPEVLEILIRDHTTQQNILWATDDYEHLGEMYSFNSHITPDLITGDNGSLIMPRAHKNKDLQKNRSKERAEVFTPSWVCNAQNNLIDNAWFGKEEVFNREIAFSDGSKGWDINSGKIEFPSGLTWKDYVRDTRLEMACGEAPYITSRYDTTTDEFIPLEQRIGIIDRKLRVINENVNSTSEWLKAAQIAYKNTYAFELHGDSLLLAREAMLITFMENYTQKFGKEPLLKSINYIAYIISWNVWQMDGLKGVVPNTCGGFTVTDVDLFGNIKTDSVFCEGCLQNKIHRHNGTYCLIKDWSNKDSKTGKSGRKIKFIDLLKNRRQ